MSLLKSKRVMALFLAAALTFTGCGTDGDISFLIPDETAPGHGKWRDSNIEGVITADDNTRLEDDFAAAKNKDAIISGEAETKSIYKIPDLVRQKKRDIINDKSITGPEAEALRTFDELASDWEYRDEIGVEPLKNMMDDIMSISTIDDYYDFICDPQRNPLCYGPVMISDPGRSEDFPDERMTLIKPGKLLLYNDISKDSVYYDAYSGLESIVGIREQVLYLTGRMGYSDSEGRKLLADNYSYEKKIVKYIKETFEDDEEGYRTTEDELYAMTSAFPMERFLSSWGYDGNKYYATDINYMKNFDKVAKTSNLEKMKANLAINYIMASADLLDREAVDYYDELQKPRTKTPEEEKYTREEMDEIRLFDTYISGTPIEAALDKLYVEKYFDEDDEKILYGMTEELLDACRVMFENEEWLSEEGKKACLEKLDKISIHIIYEDFDVVDLSSLKLKTKAEGGSLLQAYFDCQVFRRKKLAESAKRPYDRNEWDPYEGGISTTITNAMYNPTTNGIYILAGILEDPVYNKDMDREELLAGIGSIVGHELTHGFDKGGVLYDGEGLKNTILSEEDQMAFNDKSDAVAAYFSTVTPFPGAGIYDGFSVNGEATADMGGVREALILGSLTPDFDYDRFFTHFARVWCAQTTEDDEKSTINGDVHPLGYLRANITLQQFDEFYETYDIKPGDGMYLEPERRIAVW